MKQIITLALLLFAAFAFAQQPTFTIGTERTQTTLTDPEATAFRIGKNNYVLYKRFSGVEMSLRLEGFVDPEDEFFCSQDITVPHLPNEVALYEGFLPLNDKMVLFRGVFNKDQKKYTLYAHELTEKGIVKDAAGKVLTSIPAEKAMNSGNYNVKASADGKSFAVFSEYPFTKEMKEKFAVSVFDNSLNQSWTKELELAYDSKRGPVNDIIVTNSGMVYVIKKVEGPKNADFYTTYQFSNKGAQVKENLLDMEAPKKIISYGYVIDEPSNDLTIAGYYTEDGKVTVGGTGYKGYFTAKLTGSNGTFAYRSTNVFEKSLGNLKIRNVLTVKGNTFIIGERSFENNLATEQKDSRGFPIYRREYVGEDIYISAFDAAGKAIINSTIRKDNKSWEDGGYPATFAATVVGEQVMIVYNDFQYRHDGLEHKIVGPGLVGVIIPVIQFIAADGAMGKKFALIDTNIGGKQASAHLIPGIFNPIGAKEFFFLGRDQGLVYPVRLRLP
jgi:hypothetical protein